MTKLSRADSSIEETPGKKGNQTMVLRIPKPNLQVVVLGLIAVITLFQTFQLVRISSKASSASVVKTAPASDTASTNTGSGTGSNADVPESIVGGC